MANGNNKKLKAFVRYDGSGRVVAGSLVLRQNKPKVGKWQEITAYECCNNTTGGNSQSAPCSALGSVSQFTILAGSTITSTGPTVISGKIGLYPGTAVTGFPPGTISGSQEITSPAALTAQLDATSIYNQLNLLPSDGSLSGGVNQTFSPGVYDVPSELEISGGTIFDAGGISNAVFVIRVPTALLVNGPVILTGGAQAGNIYWLVGTSATINSESMKGVIIAVQSITFNIGANLQGKAIALNAAVTLNNNSITNANCTTNPIS